jgi:hypothetical protein
MLFEVQTKLAKWSHLVMVLGKAGFKDRMEGCLGDRTAAGVKREHLRRKL